MVFRRDNKSGDAFQRQISALREQLGGEAAEEPAAGGDQFSDPQAYSDQLPDTQEHPEVDYADPVPSFDDSTYSTQPVDDTADPQMPQIPSVDAQTTVISGDTSWKGEVDSQGSMHIQGKFEGVIRVRDDVYILEQASVDAAISAATVVIGGSYNGAVTCQARLEVLPTGRVKGEILSPVLVVHDGAVMNGHVRMSGKAESQSQPAALVRKRDTGDSA